MKKTIILTAAGGVLTAIGSVVSVIAAFTGQKELATVTPSINPVNLSSTPE